MFASTCALFDMTFCRHVPRPANRRVSWVLVCTRPVLWPWIVNSHKHRNLATQYWRHPLTVLSENHHSGVAQNCSSLVTTFCQIHVHLRLDCGSPTGSSKDRKRSGLRSVGRKITWWSMCLVLPHPSTSSSRKQIEHRLNQDPATHDNLVKHHVTWLHSLTQPGLYQVLVCEWLHGAEGSTFEIGRLFKYYHIHLQVLSESKYNTDEIRTLHQMII